MRFRRDGRKSIDALALEGKEVSKLSARDREYLEAFDSLSAEQREEMRKAGITGAMLDRFGPVNRDPDDVKKDPFARIADPAPWPGHEPEPESATDSRKTTAEAVLRVLYLLTGSRHPGLRLATDCLLALVNKTEEASQAAIARKHGLTRAAVSKRLRDMRKGTLLGGLEVYFFGGREEASEAARSRAIRVHNQRKTKCKQKPSPFQLQTT
jgi:hypothetical protein